MSNSKAFEIKPVRLWNFLKREYRYHLRQTLLIFGLIVAGLALLNLSGVISGEVRAGEAVLWIFVGTLLIGGPILNSVMYDERYGKKEVHEFLMLPVTRMERYLVRILTGTVGIILYLIVLSFAASLLLSLAAIPAGGEWDLFNPFSREVGITIGLFLPLQALFHFGSCYFRGTVWLKSAAILAAAGFVLSILLTVTSSLAFMPWVMRFSNPDYAAQIEQQVESKIEILDSMFAEETEPESLAELESMLNRIDVEGADEEQIIAGLISNLIRLYKILAVLFWIGYAFWILLFWLGGWLALGETEVQDAV